MQAALYYPFTGPERESFLKTSLFLWDSVDFIVPYSGFRQYTKSADEDEAIEVIGRPYVPTKRDKKAAHEELLKIAESDLAQRLAFELEDTARHYDFYPEKLLPETWEILSQSKLARIVGDGGDVSRASTGPLFGYYMMSVLAVCCSNNRKRLVTDNHDPYKALAAIMVDDPAECEDLNDWHGRLLAISLSGPNLHDIPLSKMVALRKNEDQLLESLRRTFLEKVDSTATEICANASNPNIVRELIEEFSSSMELDLRELKKALRKSAASTLLSKEFGFSICAYAAGLAGAPLTGGMSTVAGGVATVGGLGQSLFNYQDRRRKILQEHPSSWLFTAASPRLPVI